MGLLCFSASGELLKSSTEPMFVLYFLSWPQKLADRQPGQTFTQAGPLKERKRTEVQPCEPNGLSCCACAWSGGGSARASDHRRRPRGHRGFHGEAIPRCPKSFLDRERDAVAGRG